MEIDTSADFGQRVERRLREEWIIWLTTIDRSGTPQPRPVWFWWDGATFLIYSLKDSHKLDHIARNPRVALHFDGDGRGGDIIVFTGEARLDPSAPPADQMAAYAGKYHEAITQRLRMTPQGFAAQYPAALRVTPISLRGHG